MHNKLQSIFSMKNVHDEKRESERKTRKKNRNKNVEKFEKKIKWRRLGSAARGRFVMWTGTVHDVTQDIRTGKKRNSQQVQESIFHRFINQTVGTKKESKSLLLKSKSLSLSWSKKKKSIDYSVVDQCEIDL